jgi:protein SCO1
MRRVSVLFTAGLLAACAGASLADSAPPAAAEQVPLPAAPVPGGSLFNLTVPLETSRAESITLDSYRGRPLLITMFYTSCTSVCPLTTLALQRMDSALAPAERARLRILMVSLDPEHETAATLRQFAQQHHIEDARFTLATGKPGDVRLLAAALGIRYRALPDGTINHSAAIALLDREGTVLATSASITAPDSRFQALLERTLASSSAPPAAQ